MIATLAFAALMTLQEKSAGPKEMLRQLEKRLVDAESVRFSYSFRTEAEDPDNVIELAGDFAAAGKKLRLTLKGSFIGTDVSHTVLSTGEKAFVVKGDGTVEEHEVRGAVLGEILRGATARVGLILGARRSEQAQRSAADKGTALDDLCTAEAFRVDASERLDGRETTVLQYDLRMEQGKDAAVAKVRLWLDASTHLPARRRFEVEERGQRVVAVETYREWVINGVVDPKLFEVPASKE